MQNVLWILIGLMLVACGEQRRWPAEITGCVDCSTDDQAQVKQSIIDLNEKSGGTLLIPQSDGANKRFPIDLSFVDPKVIQPTDDSRNTRAALATLYDDHCSIQLSKELHKPENANYFKAVLWHELGHCAGLVHDKDEKEIMFPITQKIQAYSEEVILRFINEFRNSAHL